jgi:Family of unknown function (DUF5996)
VVGPVSSLAAVSDAWVALPFEEWRATCDTLHAHTQLLGKLAAALAPPEPELQHAALRLTARGWTTLPLPAPDGSGAIEVVLDLQAHATRIHHSDGRSRAVPLTPDRPVGEVTRDVLAATKELAGPVTVDLRPQEVGWTVALDEDVEHATYDAAHVSRYLAAATQASLALGAIRAPYRGRSTPVNAWWGTFDLAVSLFSGRPADPGADEFIRRNAGDAQQIEIGWWPGDDRHPTAAFYAFVMPPPEGFADGTVEPSAARWDAGLGEYLLDWDDVRGDTDPRAAVVAFGRSVIRHACVVCDWDPSLAASATGAIPPLR